VVTTGMGGGVKLGVTRKKREWKRQGGGVNWGGGKQGGREK